jgi:AraC-like DNA-binding protein
VQKELEHFSIDVSEGNCLTAMAAGNDSRDVRSAQIIRHKFNTIEQAEAFFEKHHDPWKLRSTGPAFTATTTLLLLGDLRVWRAGNGPAHEMMPGARSSRYLVNFLTASNMEARFSNKMETLSKGQGWIRDSSRLEFVRKHAELRMTSFDLPRKLLDDHVAKVCSYEPRSVSQPNYTIDSTQGTGRFLLNLASLVIDGFEAGQMLSSSSFPAQSFTKFILDLLVDGLIIAPHSQIQTVDSRTVRRAIDFIEGNLQRPLAIIDIAEAVGVGPRALQFAFRRQFGCSPLKYARKRRLEGVRHELMTNDRAQSVAEIAACWGFIHLGLFAQQYRELFGERPSETRRGR